MNVRWLCSEKAQQCLSSNFEPSAPKRFHRNRQARAKGPHAARMLGCCTKVAPLETIVFGDEAWQKE
eukprot:6041219-Pleurochrysis_carterae.AAC.1